MCVVLLMFDLYSPMLLIQGKSVTSILSAQPGPWTGKAISRIITWQLENPEGTREECESWLREEHGAGRLGIEPAQSKIKEPASKRARIQK